LQPQKQFLIPVREHHRRSGSFRWPCTTYLSPCSAADRLPLSQLAADLEKLHQVKTRIGAGRAPALSVIHDSTIANPEAYRIQILPAAITVLSSSDAGAYYAIQTLRDMLAFSENTLPCCTINDWPDFRRRGIYHDCSRGKVPKLATLLALVERLAHWKINELQLYIENTFRFKRHPTIGKGYSPFTPAELRKLQAHCDLHHIRLVGSLASFGHMEKTLVLPHYIHLAELPGFRGWPGGTTLCPTDPRSTKLISELYDEFIPIFKAEDFNVCGDEPWELGQGRSKRTASRIGAPRVYLNYILKLHKLCRRYGRRMNMWADIVLRHPGLLPELPKDIVLLNWEYEQDGPRLKNTKDIARAGLPFMVCPGTSSWNTHGSRLRNAIANVTEAAHQGATHGAEGLLNTDWGDNGHRNFLGISLHGFAHAAAHAWNHRAVNNASFTGTFCRRLFGAAGAKLVTPLKTLGSTYLTCGAPYRNECALYHALFEPLADPQRQTRISRLTASGCRKVIAQLHDPDIWPLPTPDMDKFEALALREFRLAAAMDTLAAQRALLAKDIAAGKTVASSRLRSIAADTRTIADFFAALWLAGNKPSRLRDNTVLFKRIETEALELVRH